jgi:sugar phosphate isomerase/epimerase
LLNANIVTNLRSFGIPDGPDVNGYDFSAEVVKLADSNKVKLCLETGNLEKLKLLGEKFESVYYCLDTGYANLDPQFTFKEYTDQLAERVIHLHLTDNYGRRRSGQIQ